MKTERRGARRAPHVAMIALLAGGLVVAGCDLAPRPASEPSTSAATASAEATTRPAIGEADATQTAVWAAYRAPVDAAAQAKDQIETPTDEPPRLPRPVAHASADEAEPHGHRHDGPARRTAGRRDAGPGGHPPLAARPDARGRSHERPLPTPRRREAAPGDPGRGLAAGPAPVPRLGVVGGERGVGRALSGRRAAQCRGLASGRSGERELGRPPPLARDAALRGGDLGERDPHEDGAHHPLPVPSRRGVSARPASGPDRCREGRHDGGGAAPSAAPLRGGRVGPASGPRALAALRRTALRS